MEISKLHLTNFLSYEQASLNLKDRGLVLSEISSNEAFWSFAQEFENLEEFRKICDDIISAKTFDFFFLNFAREKIPTKEIHRVKLFQHPEWIQYWIDISGRYVWSDPRLVVYKRGAKKWVGNRWLKLTLSSGRRHATLCKSKYEERIGVYWLVSRIVFGKKSEGLECCHRNDVMLDDHWSNLYYGTRAQNAQDAKKNGRLLSGEAHRKASEGSHKTGLEHHSTVLKPEDIPKIRQLGHEGWTAYKIAKHFGVHQKTIRSILLGYTWRNV